MRISGELNKAQLKQLRAEIERMNLTPEKRQKLLYRIMKKGVIAATERNIKRQKTPNGTQFEKRHSKRKAKLLSKITKNIGIKSSAIESKAFFKGQYKSTSSKTIPVGVVAKTQQDGLKVTQNKGQFANQTNDTQKGSITDRQVKRLRKLEHTHPKNKKAVRSSAKWLKENLSEAQAGLVICEMLAEQAKSSWNIKVPSREFLGISNTDFEKSIKRELRNINFGGSKRGKK